MKKEDVKRTENETKALVKELGDIQKEREGNFFEPREGCTYMIKSVKKGEIYECNDKGDVKIRKFDAKFLITSYFTTPEPADWMDGRTTPEHDSLNDSIFLGWFKAEALDEECYRSKKLKADKDVYTLTSNAGDKFEIVKARNPYQWVAA
jgi:cellobiose phosphorylase